MSEAFATQDASETSVSYPARLRAAREAAGLHIAALAAALKVPVRKLEALEAGRYGELPDMTFARALASSACRHLKIDPAPILEQIPQGKVPELGGARHVGINAPFQPAHDPAPINPLGWLSRPALLVAIVLLLGALVIVFLPRVEESAQAEGGSVSSPVETVEPVAAVEPEPAPAQEAAAPQESADSVADNATAGSQGEPVPLVAATGVAIPAQATSAVVPSPVAAGGSLLSIAATGESWIEVTNGTGGVVVQRVLQSGETVDFSSAPPYTVVIGRAEVAQVTVRGKPLDVSRFVRNNVARFEVK